MSWIKLTPRLDEAQSLFFLEEGHEKRRNLTAQEINTKERNGKKKESLLYK